MVINRTFKPQAAPTRDRRSLGRVQVTIDDLKVLMELLRTRGGETFEGIDDHTGDTVDVPYNEPVVVEFDEGTFTEAEDMRQLSDANLRELRVRSGDTTVHLSPFRAEALGPSQLNDLVQNIWARARQTKKRPRSFSWFNPTFKLGVPFLVFLLLTVAFGAPWSWYSIGSQSPPPSFPIERIIIIATFSVAILAVWLGALLDSRTATQGSSSKNYAIIIPLSLDEVRKQERTRNKWQNVSGVIGIVSLIVAITVAVLNRVLPVP